MIRSTMSSAAALVAGGIAFVVLYPILGVALWVSLLATAGVLVVGAASSYVVGSGDAAKGGVALNPIVDVGVLRARYVATLGMALAAGFLVVESFAFGGGTRQAIAFAVGVGVVVASATGLVVSLVRRGPKQHVTAARRLALPLWDAFASVTLALGAWQVVQTLVFSGGTARWLTFANGCALELVALAALVVHELSTERVVHALEVVGSAFDHDAGRDRERTPEHAAAA